ncbi:MAG: PAS domain-containing protein [Thermonemataceae bacterium]|nr:PAS domain-containing protein [Thermonemataceae bacterium]
MLGSIAKKSGLGSFNLKSFRSRIIASILLVGFLMIFTAYFLITQKNQIVRKNQELSSIYQPVKTYAFAAYQYTNQVISTLQANAHSTDQRISSQANEELKELWQKKAISYYDSLGKAISKRQEPELLVTYEAIESRTEKLNTFIIEAIQLNNQENRKPLYLADKQDITDTSGTVRANKALTIYNDRLAFLLSTEVGRLQKELNLYFEQLININEKASLRLLGEIASKNSFFSWLQWSAFLLTFALLLALVVLLNNNIAENIGKFNNYVETLEQGDLPQVQRLNISELDQMADKLGVITQNLQSLKQYAQGISQGKFSAELHIFDDKGEFGSAIAQMRDGLQKISQEDNIRTWRNTGIAKFSEILREESNDLDKLSEKLIAELVKYVSANQGGIFIVNEDSLSKEPYLELIAAFAYNKKKFIEKKVQKGQGLVGRAWKEGNTIYLSEIPNDYIEIRTGLGGANPRYIFIVPLKVNEEVQGVLEIASFDAFDEYKRGFIQDVANSVASTYASSKVNRQTKLLLDESNRITQRMREQEEELRQNIEELQATQEEMQRNQRELSEKEGNMRALLDNASDAIMAFNHQFRITVINKTMRNLYESIGIYLDLGKTIEEAFPGRTYEEMKAEFARVLGGERFSTFASVSIKGITYHYEIYYNPIYNERQRVMGASVFIKDVTQQKAAEIEIKIKEANLKSLINNTEDSIMAIDTDYRYLVFNEVFQKRRKEYNFKEGDNIFDTIPEQLREEWKKYYDRAMGGERFEKVIKRDMGNKKIQYREYSFNPILNEKNEIIGISVFAKDITEAKLAEAENQRIMAGLLEKQKQDKKYIDELEKQLKALQEKS